MADEGEGGGGEPGAGWHLNDPEHLVVSGSGGGFLHPTHVFCYARFRPPHDPASGAVFLRGSATVVNGGAGGSTDAAAGAGAGAAGAHLGLQLRGYSCGRGCTAGVGFLQKGEQPVLWSACVHVMCARPHLSSRHAALRF